MERVMLELYTLNADDYSNLEKLMKLCGGSITVEEHPELKRTYLNLAYDLEKVKTWTSRKGGRRKKIIAQKNTDGSYHFGMQISEVERMIADVGAVETARKLKISRATLFRKLKSARESGEDCIQ